MIKRRYRGIKPKTVLPKGAVDTQVHMYLPGFPSKSGGPPLPDGMPGPMEYSQVMEWLGIDRIVVTQANAHQKDNRNICALLEEMGEIARGVSVILPDASDENIAFLHKKGVRGARIMDLPGGAIGLDKIANVDARACLMNWVLAVQFDGSNIAQHYDVLASLNSRWILDHHGKFFKGAKPDGPEVDMVKRLIDKGNCWFKFSGCYESSILGGPDYLDIAAVAEVIASYAPDRIIWGTNFPHNSAQTTEDYPDDAELLDLTLSWLPNDTARYLALVHNPEELFDFPPVAKKNAI